MFQVFSTILLTILTASVAILALLGAIVILGNLWFWRIASLVLSGSLIIVAIFVTHTSWTLGLATGLFALLFAIPAVVAKH